MAKIPGIGKPSKSVAGGIKRAVTGKPSPKSKGSIAKRAVVGGLVTGGMSSANQRQDTTGQHATGTKPDITGGNVAKKVAVTSAKTAQKTVNVAKKVAKMAIKKAVVSGTVAAAKTGIALCFSTVICPILAGSAIVFMIIVILITGAAVLEDSTPEIGENFAIVGGGNGSNGNPSATTTPGTSPNSGALPAPDIITNNASSENNATTNYVSGPIGRSVSYNEEFRSLEFVPEHPLRRILEYWRLDSSLPISPVGIFEIWVLQTFEIAAGWRGHTGSTEQEACESLWGDYNEENPDEAFDWENPSDEWQEGWCNRLWSAVIIWDEVVKLLGQEGGLRSLSSDTTEPLLAGIQLLASNQDWWDAPFGQNIPVEEITPVMSVALWQASGFGTPDDPHDGVVTIHYSNRETNRRPYCGLSDLTFPDDGNVEDDYDDRVLVDVICHDPPTKNLCASEVLWAQGNYQENRHTPVDTEMALRDTETSGDHGHQQLVESQISHVLHCDAITQAEQEYIEDLQVWDQESGETPEDGEVIGLAGRRFLWQEVWWVSGDGNTSLYKWDREISDWRVSTPTEARSRNACAPKVDDGYLGMFMGFCAHVELFKYDPNAVGFLPFKTETETFAVGAKNWGWTPRTPLPPDFGWLFAGIYSPEINNPERAIIAWHAFTLAERLGWEPPGLNDEQLELRANLPAEGENGCARLHLLFQGDRTTFCAQRYRDSDLLASWGWGSREERTYFGVGIHTCPTRASITGSEDTPLNQAQQTALESTLVTMDKLPLPREPGKAQEYARPFKVASCLAPALKGLWEAAAREHVVLQALSAYRTLERQAQLRANACGGIPESQCSGKWVARVGRSRHNFGQAIDFVLPVTPKSQGLPRRPIDSGIHIFNFLDRNACKYGLTNYRPEPWHWDTAQRAEQTCATQNNLSQTTNTRDRTVAVTATTTATSMTETQSNRWNPPEEVGNDCRPDSRIKSGTESNVSRFAGLVCELWKTPVQRANAFCVMSYESSGNPTAEGDWHLVTSGVLEGPSIGLFQINTGNLAGAELYPFGNIRGGNLRSLYRSGPRVGKTSLSLLKEFGVVSVLVRNDIDSLDNGILVGDIDRNGRYSIEEATEMLKDPFWNIRMAHMIWKYDARGWSSSAGGPWLAQWESCSLSSYTPDR